MCFRLPDVLFSEKTLNFQMSTLSEVLPLAAPRYWPMWLLFLLLRLLVLLPYGVLVRLGRQLGRLALHLMPQRRGIAETNLRLCFPELDDDQRKILLRKSMESLGIGLFEMPLGWWATENRLKNLAHVEGLDNLLEAQKTGRGVILLSAHFTSLEFCGRLLMQYAAFHCMYRKHGNPVVEKIMGGSRNRHCKKAIQRREVRQLIRSLKGGHTVWYAQDQNTQRKQSVFVEFFGHLASTNSATSRLSKLTGALVVPYHGVRRSDGSGYDLIIEKPLDNFPTDDLKADTRRINGLIERWIRQDPEQYLWIHRRFRTRPNRSDPPYYS